MFIIFIACIYIIQYNIVKWYIKYIIFDQFLLFYILEVILETLIVFYCAIFFCLFLFTVGVGFLISCLSVFLRDVFYIYGIILTIWNYFTPVFYSIEILPAYLQTLFKFNPLFQFLNGARTIVLYGQCPSLLSLVTMGLIGVASVAIGGYVFKKNQDKFIYYV